MASCGRCFNHLGWSFSIGEETEFAGLILTYMREEPCTWYELAVPPRRQLNVHQEAGDRPNSMLARLLEMLASRGEFEDQEEMEEEDINIMQQAIAEIEDSGELDMD